MNALTAFMLITAPAGSSAQTPSQMSWPELSQSVRTVAVDLELLDKCERIYVFVKREEFTFDIEMIRDRYASLKNAPRCHDADHFPHRHVTSGLIEFNRSFLKHVEKRRVLETDRYDELTDIIDETNQIYRILDAARDARCDYYNVTSRREALQRLRDMIGEEDFRSGKLPIPVPVWRFNER